MIRFITILMLLLPTLSYGAASIVPAFGTISSATGGKVSSGQTGTNTLNVVGGTVSKIGTKPTLTIPAIPAASITAISAIVGASVATPLSDSFFGYLDGATYKKLTYTNLRANIRGFMYEVSDYASIADAVTAIGSAPATLQYNTDQTLAANLTIPANIELMPLNGAKINHTTYTINYSGVTSRWPDMQVFNGTGAVTLAGDTKLVWFGTTLDAFHAAVAATSAGFTMTTENRGYSFATTATVNKNISVIMPGDAYISHTGSGVALDFTASLQGRTQRLKVTRTTDWTTGNVGIQFKDVIDSDIYFSVSGFEKGLYAHCTSGSIGHNKFYPNEVFSNSAGMYFHNDGGSFINANNIFGGRWSVSDAVVPATARYGVVLHNAGTNNFFGPTLEIIAGSGGGQSAAVRCRGNSKWNRILDPYVEDVTYVMLAEDTSYMNKIIGHVGHTSGSAAISAKISDTSSYPGTNSIEWTSMDNVPLTGLVDVFRIAIPQRAIVNSFASATVPRYLVSGMTWLDSAGTYSYQRGDANVYLNDSYLTVDSAAALGRRIDTSVVKDFWLTFTKSTSNAIDIVAKAYDSTGALLTGGTHIQGISQNTNSTRSFAADAAFGGSYFLGPATDQVFIRVADSVKSIWIGVTADGTPIGLTGISVRSHGAMAPAISSPGYDLVTVGAYDDTDQNKLSSESVPAGGVFGNGTLIGHLDGAVGSPSGWVITNRRTTTATTGEPAAETVVAVSSITGVASGDVFGVIITADADASTKWHWTTVNGAPAAGNITMTLAVPTGYTIAAGAKVISYLPKALANI